MFQCETAIGEMVERAVAARKGEGRLMGRGKSGTETKILGDRQPWRE